MTRRQAILTLAFAPAMRAMFQARPTFARFTNGAYVDFGPGPSVMLHGREMVMPIRQVPLAEAGAMLAELRSAGWRLT